MSGEAALIWCPFPGEDTARAVIDAMFDERLIACANILTDVQSLFRWHGERDEAAECGVLCKTAAPRLDAAMARLSTLHPYDTPAIAGWTVRVDRGTLAWLEAETETS